MKLNDRHLFSTTFTRCSGVLLDLLRQSQIRGAKPSSALKWKLRSQCPILPVLIVAET